MADVEVWRAAMQVPVDDRRPTGAPQLQKASATWQRRLNRAVTGDHTPALKEWRQLLYSLAPQVGDDEFTPLLAERLAAMSRAGVTAHELLRTATAPDHPAGPLPDEHAAAAVWWRMARQLTPAVATQIGDGSHGESVTTDVTITPPPPDPPVTPNLPPNISLTVQPKVKAGKRALLTAVATDDVGVTEVNFFAGAKNVCQVKVAPYECRFRPQRRKHRFRPTRARPPRQHLPRPLPPLAGRSRSVTSSTTSTKCAASSHAAGWVRSTKGSTSTIPMNGWRSR